MRKVTPNGIRQFEIVNKTKLSRQTVHNIAKILKDEDRIKEIDGKYIPTEHYLFGIKLLADYLEDAVAKGIFSATPNIESSLYQRGIHEKDLVEQTIFKLANAIGAYMLYVFIEAIRPFQEQVSSSKQQDATEYFINTSIPLNKMFTWFKEVYDLHRQHSTAHSNESGFDFNKIYNALKTVYPSIQEVEKGFSEKMEHFFVYRSYYTLVHVVCDHEWMETNVHKIGTIYACKNCHNPSLSRKIANPGKLDKEGMLAYIHDVIIDIAERTSRNKSLFQSD